MKYFWLILSFGFALSSSLRADGVDSLFRDFVEGDGSSAQSERKPKLNPKEIINKSNGFLKDREPEMTGEEYALYEKISDTLTTNVDFALKMLESMMSEQEKPSPAFEFILGNVYYANNQPDLAEKRYRSAVTRFPSFQRAWNNLGILYYSLNRFGDAVDSFSKSITLGDRDPATFGLLGYSLEQEKNVVAAEMAYMQALSGDPNNADWKEGLLRIYISGKQYGRAESLVQKLIKERPNEPRFWLAYSGVLIAENRKLEAAVLLDTATKTGVAGVDELLLLGDLYAELKLPAEAIAAYQKIPAEARDRGEQKLIGYARALIGVGKLGEAEKSLDALKPDLTSSGKIDALQTRAELYIARKQWREARTQAEAELKLEPLSGPALLTVGRSYVEEHDFARAAFAFEAAYRIPGSTYRASLELAGIELRNRHYAKSADYLEKALSIQKTDTVEDSLARVKALIAHDPNPNG